MKTQLIKMLERNQLVDMIYMAKSGELTKRRIKVLKVNDNQFTAFCFTKLSPRTFVIDNILAIIPVKNRDHEII